MKETKNRLGDNPGPTTGAMCVNEIEGRVGDATTCAFVSVSEVVPGCKCPKGPVSIHANDGRVLMIADGQHRKLGLELASNDEQAKGPTRGIDHGDRQ